TDVINDPTALNTDVTTDFTAFTAVEIAVFTCCHTCPATFVIVDQFCITVIMAAIANAIPAMTAIIGSNDTSRVVTAATMAIMTGVIAVAATSNTPSTVTNVCTGAGNSENF